MRMQPSSAAVCRFRRRLGAEFIWLLTGHIRPIPENKMLYQMKVAATSQMSYECFYV
jgi:hypothetical protein